MLLHLHSMHPTAVSLDMLALRDIIMLCSRSTKMIHVWCVLLQRVIGVAKSDGQSRVLTLQALRDFIDELFASKQKADTKCAQSRMPRETLEHFLFTFLNHRFGLRSIVADWLTAIRGALACYGNTEHDIALFKKVCQRTGCSAFCSHVYSKLE